MVEYVFSDKTGTLTCNIMKFICFYVGKEVYGQDKIDLESKGNTIENLSNEKISKEDNISLEKVKDHL